MADARPRSGGWEGCTLVRMGRSLLALIALVSLGACSLTAPFGFGLLFGTGSGYGQGPAVLHAVGTVFGETLSIGLGDIADDAGFFLTLDEPPSPLVSLIGPGSTLDVAEGCILSTFDTSDADATALMVRRLVVLERPGLVSQLDDPLGTLLQGSSRAASDLFSTVGSVAAAVGDRAQTRLYVDRAVRLSGVCTLGNADIVVDLDLAGGWNPLLLTVEGAEAGRVSVRYSAELASDLIWYYTPSE